ncbi:filamentous hemagglutinin N-terminal domain-containing protein [Cupriavidus campinensis]
MYRVRGFSARLRGRAAGGIAGLSLLALAAQCLAAGVVPDGGTSTTAVTGADGRITVGVAGAVGGVSTNTYREFNVPRAGVDLDNAAARARTILNQVTGTNPSLLEGQLSVLGPRANVVIANPNGISVNGMVVRNMGNLALTTGQVTFNDFTVNGQLQRNLVLNTSQGAIDIGPGGLSGTLLNLELIAKQLRIGGKVENLYADASSRLRAVVGNSHAEIDASVSPTDNLTPWIAYTAPAATPAGGIALDITAAGSLMAGRIELMVTDQGAGVRHAGTAYATAGDFVVSGSGDLRLASGRIQAHRDVLVATSGLRGTGRMEAGQGAFVDTDQVELAGAVIDGVAGLSLRAGDVTLQDTMLKSSGGAVAIDTRGGFTLRDSDILAATDIALHGNTIALNSAARQSTVVANGGVLVQADADMVNAGALVQGQKRIQGAAASAGAVTVLTGGSLRNESTPDALAILFGANDDVVVRAGGDVINRHARMLSNARLDVSATGDLINETTKAAGANGAQPVIGSASGRRWLVLSKRGSTFDIDYGTVDRPGQTAYLLSETGTTLSGRNVINTGSNIYANNGSIVIRAADTFRTEGVSSGAAHFSRTCMIVCRTSASSTTAVSGGLLSAGGDIDITAGRVAENIGGRVLAVGDLSVNAPVTYATGVTGYTAIARDRGFKVFFGDTWARLYAMDVGGSWMATRRTRVSGDAVIDGGSLDGDVSVAGTTTVRRPRQQEPVSIESHVGLTSWAWR